MTLLCLAHDISRIPILQYSPWFALACLKVNNAFCPSSKEEGKLNKIRSRSLVRRGSSKVSLTIIVIIIIYTCRHYHQHSLIIFMIFVVIICITIISIIIIFFVYTNALWPSPTFHHLRYHHNHHHHCQRRYRHHPH